MLPWQSPCISVFSKCAYIIYMNKQNLNKDDFQVSHMSSLYINIHMWLINGMHLLSLTKIYLGTNWNCFWCLNYINVMVNESHRNSKY